MADQIDEAQAINDLHNDAALKRHAARPQPAGLRMCANLDCGEPISDYRRVKFAAQLCMTCQGGEESREKHFATWARR